MIDEDVFQLIHPLYIEDLVPTLSLGASGTVYLYTNVNSGANQRYYLAGNCFYIPQLDYLLNKLPSIPQDSLVHYLNSRQDLVLSLVGSKVGARVASILLSAHHFVRAQRSYGISYKIARPLALSSLIVSARNESKSTHSPLHVHCFRVLTLDSIIVRLREAGYGQELDRMMDEEDWVLDMEGFEKLPEVRKPQALTARS